MNRFPILLLLAAMLPIFSACNERIVKNAPSSAANAPGKANAEISSFTQLKSDVFESKCLSCHDGSSEKDLGSYISVRAALGDIRARLISTGSDHMPKANRPQLTPDELASVLAWIDRGAPETEDAPQVPIPIPMPQAENGFASLKAKVLDAKCNTCHHGTDPVGDSDDFTTYEGTFAFKGSIKKRILAPASSRMHMPPLGEDGNPIPDRPQLTAEESDLIVKWVEAGGPR